MSSLVGDTMSSSNGVPFGWATEYEVAVIYITSMWSELEDTRDLSAAQGLIAENGFVNYCVRFKTRLAALAKSVEDAPDLSAGFKKSVSNWYRAIDQLSRDKWNLPDEPSLESFTKQFRTAFKHLVINGGDVYAEAPGEKTRRDVDDFTRGVADTMVETLKKISKQVRDLPEKSDNTNNTV